jgi:hypothetical protein
MNPVLCSGSGDFLRHMMDATNHLRPTKATTRHGLFESFFVQIEARVERRRHALFLRTIFYQTKSDNKTCVCQFFFSVRI